MMNIIKGVAIIRPAGGSCKKVARQLTLPDLMVTAYRTDLMAGRTLQAGFMMAASLEFLVTYPRVTRW